jgi:transposase-like protein
MEQLQKAIGVLPRLAICTDAGTGLLAGVKQVFPWAEHRECFRHMMENMKKRFTGQV